MNRLSLKQDNSKIRKLILIFYLLSVLTHILVIAKIIPYTWVNGGMSESYSQQAVQSVISLVILGLLFIFVWKLTQTDKAKRWQKNLLYALVVLLTIGLVMQLLGTQFERFIMSIVLAMGISAHLLLIKNLGHTNIN